MVFFLFLNKKFSKNEVKKLIEWFITVFGSLRTARLLDKLKTLGFNFETDVGVSLGFGDLLVPPSISNVLRYSEFLEDRLKNKFLNARLSRFDLDIKVSDCWNQASESIKDDILNNFRQTDLLNPLYMMLLSGARGNITQIKQLVGLRGLMVDSQGKVVNVPIKNNLKSGIKSLEYFISCYGARKGVIDTALKTANSGYLTRKLIYVSESQFVKKPNCNTNNCQLVLVTKSNKKYYSKTLDALLGRVLSKSIFNQYLSFSAGQDICNYIAKRLMVFNKIYIRSPFTCKLNEGICQLCYGWNLACGRMVELGENVGVVAAQSISEPATQLTMRTFHTGGVFSGTAADIIRADDSGLLYYDSKKGGKILKSKDFDKCFLTLKSKKIILISSLRKRLIITLPRYSIIYVRNGERVFAKQLVAELTSWKRVKYSSSVASLTNKIKVDTQTSVSGIVKQIRDFLCVLEGNILDFFSLVFLFCQKNIYRVYNSFFNLVSDYKVLCKRRSSIRIYSSKIFFNVGTCNVLRKLNRDTFKLNKRLVHVHNLLHILEGKAFFNKNDGIKSIFVNNFIFCNSFYFKNSFINDLYINKYSFQVIESEVSCINIRNSSFFKRGTYTKIVGSLVKKGDKLFSSISSFNKAVDIVQGLPAIEAILENRFSYLTGSSKKGTKLSASQVKLDYIYRRYLKFYSQKIAVRKSIYKIQKHLVDKIKLVYSDQNVKVADKHIEVIVRQMTSKVIIDQGGESNFIKGELVSLNKIEKINSNLSNKVVYFPLIIGITKLSLLNDSFLVSSSFQQTFYTICGAALEGKCDWLHTLKGNIIVGNLVPVFTGYKNSYIKRGV